jgi:hypothetical protein
MTFFLVFLFSCSLFNKENIKDIESIEKVPMELTKDHCPSKTKLITKDQLYYCYDKSTQKKHGPSLQNEDDTYILSFYEQGKLTHFPWIYTKPNKPDWNRIHNEVIATTDSELLKDFLTKYPDKNNPLNLKVRAILIADHILPSSELFPEMEFNKCDKSTGSTRCIDGNANVIKVKQDDAELYIGYQQDTFYADINTVTKEQVIQCQNDCKCPQGQWNSLPVANAFCQIQGKDLPTETQLWMIHNDNALKKSGNDWEWTSSFSTQIPVMNVLLEQDKPCNNCTINEQYIVLSRGNRKASTGNDGHNFRCIQQSSSLLNNYPIALKKPRPIPNWTTKYNAKSWAATDPGYSKKIAQRENQSVPAKIDYHYLDVFMVSDLIWAYHKAYPKITKVYQIGESNDGFPLLAIRISDNPTKDENEPAVLINGAHHGDEQLSVLFAFNDLDYLLTNSSPQQKNSTAAYIEHFDIWLIPLVNPDGNWTTLRSNKKYNVGRKNGRNTDKSCNTDGIYEGVDLNRNYPFCWGCLGERGSKSDPNTFYYRGTKPASEPEAQAMISLAKKYRFTAAISWHTNGTMIISPYTIEGNKTPNPNIPWKVAEKLVSKTPLQPNSKKFVVKSSMYPVDGTDQDWHFHEHGTIAYIIEGSHHNPMDMSIRKASVKGTAAITPTLLNILYTSPSVDGYILDENGKPLEAQVHIKEHSFFQGEKWTSRPYDGYFYRLLLNSGNYTLVVSKKGYKTVEQTITVSNSPKELNITLKRQ